MKSVQAPLWRGKKRNNECSIHCQRLCEFEHFEEILFKARRYCDCLFRTFVCKRFKMKSVQAEVCSVVLSEYQPFRRDGTSITSPSREERKKKTKTPAKTLIYLCKFSHQRYVLNVVLKKKIISFAKLQIV